MKYLSWTKNLPSLDKNNRVRKCLQDVLVPCLLKIYSTRQQQNLPSTCYSMLRVLSSKIKKYTSITWIFSFIYDLSIKEVCLFQPTDIKIICKFFIWDWLIKSLQNQSSERWQNWWILKLFLISSSLNFLLRPPHQKSLLKCTYCRRVL